MAKQLREIKPLGESWILEYDSRGNVLWRANTLRLFECVDVDDEPTREKSEDERRD